MPLKAINEAGLDKHDELSYHLTMDEKVTHIKKAKEKPLDPREAQKLVNGLAQDSSNVRIRKGHAPFRMGGRDFLYNDVLAILREGYINDPPSFKDGEWRYVVRYFRFRGKRDAACVVTFKKVSKVDVVTVMWIDIGK